MINQPTSQSMNRHSSPVVFIQSGVAAGGVTGFIYGLYQGAKVTGCPETCKSYMSLANSQGSLGGLISNSGACAGISLGICLAVSCLGAVTMGAIGYACAEPQEKERFYQELVTGELFSLICECGPPTRRGLRGGNQDNINNPVFDPTDDAPEETNITSHPVPEPPPYEDLFPEPPSYENTARMVSSDTASSGIASSGIASSGRAARQSCESQDTTIPSTATT